MHRFTSPQFLTILKNKYTAYQCAPTFFRLFVHPLQVVSVLDALLNLFLQFLIQLQMITQTSRNGMKNPIKDMLMVEGEVKMRTGQFFCLSFFFLFTCGTQVLKQRLKTPQVPPPHPRISSGSFSSSLFYLGNAKKLPAEISPKKQFFFFKTREKFSILLIHPVANFSNNNPLIR